RVSRRYPHPPPRRPLGAVGRQLGGTHRARPEANLSEGGVESPPSADHLLRARVLSRPQPRLQQLPDLLLGGVEDARPRRTGEAAETARTASVTGGGRRVCEHLQEGRASARPQRPVRGARLVPRRARALLRSATAAQKRGPPGCAPANRVCSKSTRKFFTNPAPSTCDGYAGAPPLGSWCRCLVQLSSSTRQGGALSITVTEALPQCTCARSSGASCSWRSVSE